VTEKTNKKRDKSMRIRESKEKARDLHIIRRAALHLVFPTCYVCGYALDGKSFDMYVAEKTMKVFFRVMSDSDVQIDYCHLDARSKGGYWTEENLTVGHHYCNMAQRDDSIETFVKVYQTDLTPVEIRSRSRQAKIMADDMIAGKVFYPAIAKIAADMILAGKPHRTGAEWKRKLNVA
jgi:hypothetical protein